MADVPAKRKRTIEETYQKKTQLEHILIRPDTYIGSIETLTEKLWVWDSLDEGEGEMAYRDVTFVPGLYKIFDEILVNAADNKQRDSSQSQIKVEINSRDGYIKVWNDGEGIPVEIHKEHKMYVPELIFGHLLTGSNYDDDEKKTTGGRNGYGAKLANIFSRKFMVETSHKGSRRMFKKVWRNNMSSGDDSVITPNKDRDFTCVTFWPDFAKFKLAGLDVDHVALLSKRVYDVAGNTPKDLRVSLNGRRLPVNDFQAYVDLFPGMGEEKKKDSYAEVNDRWQICVRPSNIDFQQMSFVNSIWTIKGGKHVQYIVDQIVEKVTEAVKKKHKKIDIKPMMVKQFLWVFVNARIENPAFDSQTKETLNTVRAKFGSRCEVPQKMIDTLCKVIMERVLARANDKLDRMMANKVSGAKQGKIFGIPKLVDANEAGGRKSKNCTLILTEGDSAKALVMSGLKEVGCDFYGVFPLRGKLLNVREAAKKQVSENKEIQALVKIIGLKMGHEYKSADELRYGCVMIMTDQDTDGSHIKGLVVNFFHTFWPSLLRLPGFLVQFITPVVKAFVSGVQRVATDGIPFYNIPDMLEFKEKAARERKKYEFKYYKGLGSSDNSEAKQYFSQLADHRITFNYDRTDNTDDRHIRLAFAKDQIENRKVWITGHSADDGGLDFKSARRTGVTFTDFVQKELVYFSVADCERSIPHVLDGLKPAQRKALWASFKRNLRKEIRVSQLTGYVSEKACYHHGEASMQGTIISMAQDFVGSNNLPLLMPCGQFGTRLSGGKDAASARYLHTKLHTIARLLFNRTDDFLLKYKDDDGIAVEPEFYVPILPTVLVNGCHGIGTGFATNIPNYNPLDLVENVRRLIRGDPQEALVPWYRGHTGEMKSAGPGRFVSVGKVEIVDHRVVRVTELPVQFWIEEFQSNLDEMLQKGYICEVRSHTTPEQIDCDIGFHPDVLRKLTATRGTDALHDVFKLRRHVPETNLVCFDRQGKMKKYESPMAILEEWYYVRLQYYTLRKEYLVDDMQRTCEKLRNMVRFIREVNSDTLRVQKRKKVELLEELKERKYVGFPKQQKLNLHKNSFETEDKPEEEDDPSARFFKDDEGGPKTNTEADRLSGEYDYLLGMKIWQLTHERAERLEEQLRTAEGELEQLRKTPEKDMWLADLAQLETAINKANVDWQDSQGKSSKKSASSKKVTKERLEASRMKPARMDETQMKEINTWLAKADLKADRAIKGLEKEDKKLKAKSATVDALGSPPRAGGSRADAEDVAMDLLDNFDSFGLTTESTPLVTDTQAAKPVSKSTSSGAARKPRQPKSDAPKATRTRQPKPKSGSPQTKRKPAAKVAGKKRKRRVDSDDESDMDTDSDDDDDDDDDDDEDDSDESSTDEEESEESSDDDRPGKRKRLALTSSTTTRKPRGETKPRAAAPRKPKPAASFTGDDDIDAILGNYSPPKATAPPKPAAQSAFTLDDGFLDSE